jgi:hypothetical protein
MQYYNPHNALRDPYCDPSWTRIIRVKMRISGQIVTKLTPITNAASWGLQLPWFIAGFVSRVVVSRKMTISDKKNTPTKIYCNLHEDYISHNTLRPRKWNNASWLKEDNNMKKTTSLKF